MAKYTLEKIMYGDKYGIESAVFVEVFKMVEQKVDVKTIREQLNMIYLKHALLTAKRMIEEGNSISDIMSYNNLDRITMHKVVDEFEVKLTNITSQRIMP